MSSEVLKKTLQKQNANKQLSIWLSYQSIQLIAMKFMAIHTLKNGKKQKFKTKRIFQKKHITKTKMLYKSKN